MTKTITTYMVYGISPDRKEGFSASLPTTADALASVDLNRLRGWHAYYIEQTWEEAE